MVPDLDPRVTLPWLLRLRWMAFLGQIVALSVAHGVFDVAMPWASLAALVLLLGVSNGVLAAVARRPELPWDAARITGVVLAFDVVQLTAILGLTGGAMNPFTVLYLVHITLAATVLGARWTTFLAALSVAGFGLLFVLVPEPKPDPAMEAMMAMHHIENVGGPMGHHLHGMWIAFVLAAALVTYFVRGAALALARQREEIASLRERAAKSAQLAAVTTLAAGAAHEIGSPLSTIAVAAHEVGRAMDQGKRLEDIRADVQLIEAEVSRCHDVLAQMAGRSAEPFDPDADLSFAELPERVRAHVGADRAARVDFAVAAESAALRVPAAQTTQAITALVRNALDASPDGGRVAVRMAAGAAAEITVEDRGDGIPEDVLGRIGEPFFTTKGTGKGLGLGVFLVRAFAESRGGALRFESERGRGTRAIMTWPLSPPAGQP